jgi:hypothetical protein
VEQVTLSADGALGHRDEQSGDLVNGQITAGV